MGVTKLPKEYIVPARWKQLSVDYYALINDKSETIATINGCLIKTLNRNGGWNYAIAASLAAAKRKAAKMMREEQR